MGQEVTARQISCGPSLGGTVWDDVTVINHCALYRNGRPFGVLFLMDYPELPKDGCPGHRTYQVQLIHPLPDGSTIASCSVRRILMDWLEEQLSPTTPARPHRPAPAGRPPAEAPPALPPALLLVC